MLSWYCGRFRFCGEWRIWQYRCSCSAVIRFGTADAGDRLSLENTVAGRKTPVIQKYVVMTAVCKSKRSNSPEIRPPPYLYTIGYRHIAMAQFPVSGRKIFTQEVSGTCRPRLTGL